MNRFVSADLTKSIPAATTGFGEVDGPIIPLAGIQDFKVLSASLGLDEGGGTRKLLRLGVITIGVNFLDGAGAPLDFLDFAASENASWTDASAPPLSDSAVVSNEEGPLIHFAGGQWPLGAVAVQLYGFVSYVKNSDGAGAHNLLMSLRAVLDY